MKSYFTIPQIKKYVRDELQAPAEFIKHLARFDTFSELKKAYAEGDDGIVHDIMKEMRDGYKDYCKAAKLDYEADNRNAKPGFFYCL